MPIKVSVDEPGISARTVQVRSVLPIVMRNAISKFSQQLNSSKSSARSKKGVPAFCLEYDTKRTDQQLSALEQTTIALKLAENITSNTGHRLSLLRRPVTLMPLRFRDKGRQQ